MKFPFLALCLFAVTAILTSSSMAREHTHSSLQTYEVNLKNANNTGSFVSLNCAVIKSDLKRMMCASPEIMGAETKLRDLYQKVEARAREPQVLVFEQKAWRKKLVECKSEKCLLERFKLRENTLSTWIANENKRAKEKENCQGKDCWPEASAMHTGYVLREELNELTPALQSQFERLLGLLSNTQGSNGRPYIESRILSGLESQQRSWKKYILDECELVGALSGAGGTWPSTWALNCELIQAKNRLRDVKNVIACIEKLPSENRGIDQHTCLRELIPLSKNINPS